MKVEHVRDDVLVKMRSEVVELIAKIADGAEATPQEGVLALIQAAGIALATFSFEKAPNDHVVNISWGVRNLVGVYAQIAGIDVDTVMEAYSKAIPVETTH